MSTGISEMQINILSIFSLGRPWIYWILHRETDKASVVKTAEYDVASPQYLYDK